MFDAIKYGMKKSKEKKECKQGNHTPGMNSWVSNGYTYSTCIYCYKKIFQFSDGTWKPTL